MMSNSPPLDESIVPIKLSIVVLPPPDGPLIITNSPLSDLLYWEILLFYRIKFTIIIENVINK